MAILLTITSEKTSLSRRVVSRAKILPKSCPNTAQILPEYCPNTARILAEYSPNFTPPSDSRPQSDIQLRGRTPRVANHLDERTTPRKPDPSRKAE